MIKTTVADIVRSTVTTDDPLATLCEEVAQLSELLASFATLLSTSLNHGFELLSGCAACYCIVLSIDPFLSSCLVFCRSFFGSDNVLQQLLNACTHLLVSKDHTHTKLAEVFEQ